jgi:DNA-binding NarL/FixJ family response regulator
MVLLRSCHIAWSGLRQICEEGFGIEVVGDTELPHDAVIFVRTGHPAVILVDIDIVGECIEAVLASLRDANPFIKIIAVGERTDCAILAALVKLGVHGFLRWSDLHPASIYTCLSDVMECSEYTDRLTIVEAQDLSFVRPNSFPQRADLSEREAAVLQGLLCGLTQAEIARRQAISRQLVDRVIAALKEKLDAPSLFLLGVNSALLGLATSASGSSKKA